MVFGQLVILSDRVLQLMTSNPDYIPLVDIIQGHFHKSFELLVKIGLWLTVNAVWGPQDEGFPTVLMSAVIGCKLAKLGWNKIEHQNTFFPRCLCDPESSGTIGTLLAPADSTGTIKRVCWHKPPKWRPLKTCRALNSQNRNVSVSTGSNWRSPSGDEYYLV